jgi:hypothetical protein
VSEHGLATPPRERFRINVQAARQVRARDLLVRFVFGAITSAVAAVVTLAFGPRAGGIFLAFPAILAATVTLIEDEESASEAREDARGAIVGSIALAVFAACAAALFGEIAGGLALAAASGAWCVVAIGLYLVLWCARG